MRGPIDYLVVGFEGNKFDGSVLEALSDAIDKNIIRVIALGFVQKDTDGTLTQLNVTDSGDEVIASFSQKYVTDGSAITQDDIDEVGDILEPDTAAGLLVLEHVWALPLKKALIDANGYLIAEGRIHPEAQTELEGGN
ncbi:hypothetical protein H6795_00515 [Candidatus Nomurabacteria bacterium]|nr:hypothetical protein [Candidatus Nomurabacteria bacterium]